MSLFPEETPYRVLARKYRPAGFDALIGQDAVVQTLGNAIRSNRLAQAWLLTGVRGVGKTSIARIIAKALNCTGADGRGGPTISPCGQCDTCTGIATGQHIDVIEIDAATNTKVEQMRDLLDGVPYSTVSARYRIYIIDEVHMLSASSFAALLKTLEEPPPHVKFIFATTEVQKLPATILSRCQRFDLKRIPHDLLAAHFARIVEAEAVSAEPEAIAIIARAAEGSVRDGLSILDQAIALSGEQVTAASVREMLGLADHGRTARLLGHLLEADPKAVLAALAEAHDAGVEPNALFAALLELVHRVTRAKIAGETDAGFDEAERARIADWAEKLGFSLLHRLWQLLLKGLADIQQAPVPQQAAEMAALRIVHAAAMPDPDTLARLTEPGSTTLPAPRSAPASVPAPVPVATDLPSDAATLVALFEDRREAAIARRLRDDVAIVSVQPGALSLAEVRPLPPGFAAAVRDHLLEWTGRAWTITVAPPVDGAETLRQSGERQAVAARETALADPLVAALMAGFPGSELHLPSPEPVKRSA